MSTTTQQKKISELSDVDVLTNDDLMIISKNTDYGTTFNSHKITTK